MGIEEIFLESSLGLIRVRDKYPKVWEGVITGHYKIRVTEIKSVGRRFPVVFPTGYNVQTLLLRSYHPEAWSSPEKMSLRGIKNKVEDLKLKSRKAVW